MNRLRLSYPLTFRYGLNSIHNIRYDCLYKNWRALPNPPLYSFDNFLKQ